MHLMAAIPNPGPYLEYGIEESLWVVGAFDPPLEMVGGCVTIPSEPGWGVRMSEEWLANTEHRCTELHAE
jgi:L-alanine-DL-glutamate epimerase-like enolase superfamily enzyme